MPDNSVGVGNLIGGFFGEEAVEETVEEGGVGQQVMELLQPPGVVAPGNPDFQIVVGAYLLIRWSIARRRWPSLSSSG